MWPRRVSRVEDVHQPGRPCGCAHLSRRVQGAVRPPAHAGDPAEAGVVGADERLQLLVREAAGLRYSVESRDIHEVQHGPRAHAARAPQHRKQAFECLSCSRKAPMQVGVLRWVLCCHEAKVPWTLSGGRSVASPPVAGCMPTASHHSESKLQGADPVEYACVKRSKQSKMMLFLHLFQPCLTIIVGQDRGVRRSMPKAYTPARPRTPPPRIGSGGIGEPKRCIYLEVAKDCAQVCSLL
eukprot:364630-Chlamydomonas_euryale.AAC.2